MTCRIHAALAVLMCLAMPTTPVVGQCITAEISAFDAAAGDQFGDAVDIDVDRMIVGASRDDDLATGSGSAYIYQYDDVDAVWVLEEKLTAFDGEANDLFGWAVGIEGEWAVVGAYLEDEAAGGAGAVYIYRHDPDDLDGDTILWEFEVKLLAPDAASGDEFGESIALSGTAVVIGAARDDDFGSNSGAAYVFRYDGVNWVADATRLTASDGSGGDQFGSTVAIDGTAVLVGAAFNDDAGTSSGAAYVFRDNGTAFVEETKLTASNAQGGDQFGRGLAVHGGMAIVGAPLTDSVSLNAGAAYVFRDMGGGTWVEEEILVPNNLGTQAEFGHAVGVLDEPGGAIGLIAIPGDFGNQSASGTVAYYRELAGVWIEQARLFPDNGVTDDEFGASLVLAGDRAIVGANKRDVGGGNAGAAYELSGFLSEDCDGNGIADSCEEDCNDNGVADPCDILDGTSMDINGDGIPDECEDCNDNGIPDIDELSMETDCDSNSLLDECELAADPELDMNENGVLDVCEPDCNANGLPDDLDLEQCDGSPECSDCNGNGILDECDILDGTSVDDNANMIPDECEDCNENATADDLDIAKGISLDCDEDGVPDECQIPFDSAAPGGPYFCEFDCDPDCNENGTPDSCDIAEDPQLDLNGNGVIDTCDQDCNQNSIPDFGDIKFGVSEDCNGNGVPDECEISIDSGAPGGPFFCEEECDTDCNDNGVPDACDIVDDPDLDMDGNGVLDACDPDCNENGVADHIDIANEDSMDVNSNGVPDECEDCNDNDTPDDIDIADEVSADCNSNGVPDECEIDVNSNAPGGPYYCVAECDADCNSNGVPDACDIADGTSPDFNIDGVPDECEPDCNNNNIPDSLDIFWGISIDANENGVPDECEGNGDLDNDGDVDVLDLLALLGGWGTCPNPPDECPADLDGDGLVGVLDLLMLLGDWG